MQKTKGERQRSNFQDMKEKTEGSIIRGGNFVTVNRFLNKVFARKVLFEDVGYDAYRDCNMYACICPSCGLRLIEFDDYDIPLNEDSDDIETMFKSSMIHHAYEGRNTFCNCCGQKLDWGSYK